MAIRFDNRNISLLTRRTLMPANIFYIIGVVVVVLFILGWLGLR